MALDPAIEVSEFSASAAPKVAGRNAPHPSAKNWSPVLLGLAGTLSLHGLAVQLLVFGSVNHKPRLPEMQSAGAARVSAAPAEELVLVTVTQASKVDSDLIDQIASLRPHLRNLPIPIASPDLPAIDEASSEATSDSTSQTTLDAGDPALRALMFGRYTHQISARIERAWVRPRAPMHGTNTKDSDYLNLAPVDQEFRCRVQIRQNARGFVQEVLLLKCNGTDLWRRSLVVAINQSSPLPAPPIPSVFSRALTMTFQAHVYRPGDNPDAYEVRTQVETHPVASNLVSSAR